MSGLVPSLAVWDTRESKGVLGTSPSVWAHKVAWARSPVVILSPALVFGVRQDGKGLRSPSSHLWATWNCKV